MVCTFVLKYSPRMLSRPMNKFWIRNVVFGTLAVFAVAVITAVGMRQSMWRFEYRSADEAPEADVALVLGASVYRGKPSPVLAARADTAIELYRAQKVAKILVSGDDGDRAHDEVTPVRKYLVEAGVAPEDIFLDHAGFDTYSSMYRAVRVFGAEKVIVVTQDFHMPRALWIARHLGMPAVGLVANDSDGPLSDYVREVPASLKAFLDVVFKRQPRYLGDPIPLSGTGTSTWY